MDEQHDPVCISESCSFISNSGECCDVAISHVTCGVPQGSVLSPLILILHVYSNNILITGSNIPSQSYSQSTRCHDCIYISGKDATDLLRCMSHDLSQLNDWFKANKLSLTC